MPDGSTNSYLVSVAFDFSIVITPFSVAILNFKKIVNNRMERRDSVYYVSLESWGNYYL